MAKSKRSATQRVRPANKVRKSESMKSIEWMEGYLSGVVQTVQHFKVALASARKMAP